MVSPGSAARRSTGSAEIGMLPLNGEPTYGSRVDTRARALAVIAAVEAIFLGYAATVAFFTPTGSSEHSLVLAVALLCLAAPLAWYAASTLLNRRVRANVHLGRVVLPNAVLLTMCFSVLQSKDGYGTVSALVAVLAAAVIVAALRLTDPRTRSTVDV